MPREIKPSSAEWTEIDALMYILACIKNPQLFYDLEPQFKDEYLDTNRMPIEGEILVGKLLDDIQEIIDA